jgi:hypothetical protein
MALVWQYGEQSGYESWKGLSWGMVSYCSHSCNIDRLDVLSSMEKYL